MAPSCTARHSALAHTLETQSRCPIQQVQHPNVSGDARFREVRRLFIPLGTRRLPFLRGGVGEREDELELERSSRTLLRLPFLGGEREREREGDRELERKRGGGE